MGKETSQARVGTIETLESDPVSGQTHLYKQGGKTKVRTKGPGVLCRYTSSETAQQRTQTRSVPAQQSDPGIRRGQCNHTRGTGKPQTQDTNTRGSKKTDHVRGDSPRKKGGHSEPCRHIPEQETSRVITDTLGLWSNIPDQYRHAWRTREPTRVKVDTLGE